MLRILGFLAMGMLVSSCVSSGKYEKLEGQFNDSQKAKAELLAENESLKKEILGLQEEVKQQGVVIQTLKGQLGHASSNVEEMKAALKQAADRKKEAERRIKEYSNLLSRFKKLIDAGKLQVKIVRGRMIVELDSDILFNSGSANMADKGKTSIKEVAKVLASIPERQFQIEGHTDNVPIKTSKYPSNWELASSRALTVLRTMLDEGMPPERISIASFGEHRPVNSNESPEEKAANRRIEIVVLPDLSTLPGFDELNNISGAASR